MIDCGRRNSCVRPDKTNNATAATCVCVCVCTTLRIGYGDKSLKKLSHTHSTTQHSTDCDLTSVEATKQKQKIFHLFPVEVALPERERGGYVKGCTSAWRTHLFNSFSYISAIFFSIMCRHVPATCSPICPVPFSDCLHCFLFFCIFVFLFKELSFSVPQLGLLALRFSLPRWQSQRVSQEQHRKKGKYL